MNYYMGQQKIVCCVMYYLLYIKEEDWEIPKIEESIQIQISKSKRKQRTKKEQKENNY